MGETVMTIIWHGLLISSNNYTIENGNIIFAFGNYEIIVPENEIE
jgi:hypothetical protein